MIELPRGRYLGKPIGGPPGDEAEHFVRCPALRRMDRLPWENAMSATSPTRRALLAASVAIGAVSLLPANFAAVADDNTVRPYKINVPDEALVDLRRRIAATRWPDRETVDDQ